jgi:cell division protein FtsW
MRRKADKIFLIITLVLVFFGFLLFTSASLGLLVGDGASFSAVTFNQIFFGLIGGGVAMFLLSKVDYHFWKRYSFYIFLLSLFATLLVFAPGIGRSFGGATRWISFGPISFQPAEFLKLGFVIYLAAWLSGVRTKVRTFKFGLLPLLIVLGIISLILLNQPDTGTLVVIFVTGLTMFIVAGGRWRDVFLTGLVSVGGILVLALARPYILERIMTFIKPGADPLGAGYQIEQSLIAIGSGQWFGRGFGQSIQKFNFLPEPIGDSIFAVIAEEWGFIGASALIILFLLFAFRGLKIAANSKDIFSGLLATGIVILITAQSLINIASMLEIFPLTGMPLLFVSHGGTALFFAMAEVGIVLNISKYKKS